MPIIESTLFDDSPVKKRERGKAGSYEFEFITDSRFNGTRAKLESMDAELKRALSGLPSVSLTDATEIYELNFTGDEACKQWRKRYVVSKNSGKPTWNEVMSRINQIKAPYYKRV